MKGATLSEKGHAMHLDGRIDAFARVQVTVTTNAPPGYLLSPDTQEPRASWRRIHAGSDGGKPIRRRSKLSWNRLVHIPRLPSRSNKAGVSGVTIVR
jgi:hypothetical protein